MPSFPAGSRLRSRRLRSQAEERIVTKCALARLRWNHAAGKFAPPDVPHLPFSQPPRRAASAPAAAPVAANTAMIIGKKDHGAAGNMMEKSSHSHMPMVGAPCVRKARGSQC
jgi:hypothetical protein